MARLNKKLWEAWQNGYIYSIWATSRSAALRALKSKYGGKFTRIRQYPGIGKENPRRVKGNPKRRMRIYRGFELRYSHATREWGAWGDTYQGHIGPFSSLKALKSRIDALTGKKTNPRRVKGTKCNGGRSVSLRNFTGRVIKKRDGTVQIVGRTRKTK